MSARPPSRASSDSTLERSATSSTLNDAESLRHNGSVSSTLTGVSAQDNDPRTLPSRRTVSLLDQRIRQIASEYEIQPTMRDRLRQLQGFEIVIVCDDSGSMMTPVDNGKQTRWDELGAIVKTVLTFATVFDTNGVDVYFLNRPPLLRVKDPKEIDGEFAKPACGYTSLVPVLDKIFTSKLALPGRDKKLLVFVATDGIPTDDDGDSNVEELEYLMREVRNIDTTYVSFLVCTDDAACVDYLNEWDRTMRNVDVTDDFHTEREKIRRHQKQKNYPFSRGDYVVKALLGAIDAEMDALNG